VRRPLPYFDSPVPRVLAHRGLATGGALENSLGAFAAALAAGAHYLETDAHATADGHAVLLHDPELRRIGDLDLAVASLTLTELRAVGPVGEQICTLVDALQTFPSARFNIDVKSAAAASSVARAVRDAGAQDRVLIASFRSARRKAALAPLAPLGDVATSASALQVLGGVLAVRVGLRGLARVALRHVDAVQIPERVLGIRVTTKRMVKGLHDAGVEVHVWTVNDPRDMERLIGAGVDGLVSDRCDLLAEVVRGRS
jgi:glycerophosphoryl diester phosphodiesterase